MEQVNIRKIPIISELAVPVINEIKVTQLITENNKDKHFHGYQYTAEGDANSKLLLNRTIPFYNTNFIYQLSRKYTEDSDDKFLYLMMKEVFIRKSSFSDSLLLERGFTATKDKSFETAGGGIPTPLMIRNDLSEPGFYTTKVINPDPKSSQIRYQYGKWIKISNIDYALHGIVYEQMSIRINDEIVMHYIKEYNVGLLDSTRYYDSIGKTIPRLVFEVYYNNGYINSFHIYTGYKRIIITKINDLPLTYGVQSFDIGNDSLIFVDIYILDMETNTLSNNVKYHINGIFGRLEINTGRGYIPIRKHFEDQISYNSKIYDILLPYLTVMPIAKIVKGYLINHEDIRYLRNIFEKAIKESGTTEDVKENLALMDRVLS
ncbi:MAG: hypothetical protein Solumvirus6_4 [Solumvirus sp.]|uniref:Uncharacterized protein n=1 Tax=Solumvirus sp. TaxID=2487773 RepID=A0A3G5AKG9_9VIRU|nr:MAG: hypothetical protein Solumvirus6_4 [Solumvirus sp.]